MRRALVLALGLASQGCAFDSQLAARSQGAVGCRSDQIVISDREGGVFAPLSWSATCGGKRYLCSALGYDTNCTPEVAQP